MKTFIYNIISIILLSVAVSSCIEDSVATSPQVQPLFSVDTLKMGSVITSQGTPTFRFTVYNRHDKILNIDRIALRSGSTTFRMNVDGFSGRDFSNIQIRPNDSIFVFIEATLPEQSAPGLIEVKDHVDFTTRGVTRTVVLDADGFDVKRHRGEIITADTRFTAEYPHQIFDSLVVAPGATLTIEPGTRMMFHDGASMKVYGTLQSLGTPEAPVHFSGDRTDNVVGSISFDLMASQWQGLTFAPESKGNLLSHSIVRNTVSGVLADSLSQVTIINSRLRNSAGRSLTAWHADVTAMGTEIAEAAYGTLLLHGGKARLDHCTIANYYLFSVLYGEAVQLSHTDDDTDDQSGLPRLDAVFTNSIIYGNGTDLSHGDLTGMNVTFTRCLFKSEGEDDENFIECLWDADPLYYTERSKYIFDYRVKPESPAIGYDSPALSLPLAPADFYGTPRAGTIGAYEFVEESDKSEL